MISMSDKSEGLFLVGLLFAGVGIGLILIGVSSLILANTQCSEGCQKIACEMNETQCLAHTMEPTRYPPEIVGVNVTTKDGRITHVVLPASALGDKASKQPRSTATGLTKEEMRAICLSQP